MARKKAEKITRITHTQFVAIKEHLEKNEGSYRGMTYKEAAPVISESVGFEVPIATLQTQVKHYGFNVGGDVPQRRGRTAKSIDSDLQDAITNLIRLEERFNGLIRFMLDSGAELPEAIVPKEWVKN